MQGMLFPRNEDERRKLLDDGYDLDRVLATDDLVAGDDVFFAATGVTDGALLEGVKYWPDGATTYSLVMRARSGTIRMIEAEHQFEKLERFTGRTYRR
jgi:fructose-1,6-bisphosphatase II